MKLHKSPGLLLLAVTLFAASGASCPQAIRRYTSPPPRVLSVTPTKEEVIQAVNANNDRIERLYSEQSSISVPSMPLMPTLRAHIALERPLTAMDQPRNFRLTADSPILGPQVDLGSNHELFWFWVKQSPEPAIFFCRHDRFETSGARSLLPIEPDWIVDALGLSHLDPEGRHEGPFPAGKGRLMLRSYLPAAHGYLTKQTVVDEREGLVLEQHLYDERGQLLASALASNHARDPLSGVTLPSRVEVHLPATRSAAAFSLRLDLRNVMVNYLPDDPDKFWTMPEIPGAREIDLADPRLHAPPANTATAPPPIGAPPSATRSFGQHGPYQPGGYPSGPGGSSPYGSGGSSAGPAGVYSGRAPTRR